MKWHVWPPGDVQNYTYYYYGSDDIVFDTIAEMMLSPTAHTFMPIETCLMFSWIILTMCMSLAMK